MSSGFSFRSECVLIAKGKTFVGLCWPSFTCPCKDCIQITANPQFFIQKSPRTVGASVFRIRTLWRCSLGLSRVHLTEVVFHFSCQSGLGGPNGSRSAAQEEDVVNGVVVPVKMFSGWHERSPNHTVPLGSNKEGLRGNDVVSQRPEGGSNKFKLHSSSPINWPFSPPKGCHIASGYVFTKLFVFAPFKIDCRLLYTRH